MIDTTVGRSTFVYIGRTIYIAHYVIHSLNRYVHTSSLCVKVDVEVSRLWVDPRNVGTLNDHPFPVQFGEGVDGLAVLGMFSPPHMDIYAGIPEDAVEEFLPRRRGRCRTDIGVHD